MIEREEEWNSPGPNTGYFPTEESLMPITNEDVGYATAPSSVPSSIEEFKAALFSAEARVHRLSHENHLLRGALECAMRWMYLNSADHVRDGIPEKERKNLDVSYIGDIARIRAALNNR